MITGVFIELSVFYTPLLECPYSILVITESSSKIISGKSLLMLWKYFAFIFFSAKNFVSAFVHNNFKNCLELKRYLWAIEHVMKSFFFLHSFSFCTFKKCF